MTNYNEFGESGAIPRPWKAIYFRGNFPEYFRIWIVNTILTVVTLGIYGAWAKVRNRRYIYSNTEFAGERFDFIADPRKILIGNIIIITLALAYLFGSHVSLVIPGLTLLLIGILYPYFLWKSLRFRVRYTTYRNIGFSFHGSLGEAYLLYLVFNLLNPFCLGLLTPYIHFRRQMYFYNNLRWGDQAFRFHGEVGFFWKLFLKVILLIFGYFILMGVMFAGMTVSGNIGVSLIIFILFYLMIIAGSVGLATYTSVRILNYVLSNSQLGEFRFNPEYRVREYFSIRVMNTIGVSVSLGLLTPWAEIRRFRYLLENIYVQAEETQLEAITAELQSREGALGESAADIFDFEMDFGLK